VLEDFKLESVYVFLKMEHYEKNLHWISSSYN